MATASAVGDDPAAVLARRSAGAPTPVLTPHEGEFRRLGGSLDPADPSVDRIGAVRDLAAHLSAIVLLKGPTTVVADPSGAVLLCDVGDERLASAGTGDVLTGVVAALLARGSPLSTRRRPRRGCTAGPRSWARVPDSSRATCRHASPPSSRTPHRQRCGDRE